MGATVAIALAPDMAVIADAALQPVRSVLTGETIIGLRRSGAICAPAGKLLWREVAMEGGALAQRTARALRDEGTGMAVADTDRLDDRLPAARSKIVATIDRITMRACVPWRGLRLGSTPILKTNGRLIVTWRIFAGVDDVLATKVTSCLNFTVNDAATVHGAFERAFAESAAAIVPMIVADRQGGRGLVLPATAICSAEDLSKG